MPVSTIGDMRQFFMTSRQNTEIKTELNTLVQELTSGEVSDLTAHLGSAQTQLAGIDRQLELLGRFSQSNVQAAQMLTVMQTALSSADGHRQTASGTLLTINETSTPSQISEAANVAESGFKATVLALNMRSGDRALFGGNDLDSNPLADADVMLDALRADVAGLTNAADVSAAIETWFDAPAGGFETLGYQGDPAGYQSRTMATDQSIDIGVRADDQAIRDTLKALAKGALSGDTAIAFDVGERQQLQSQAGVDLLTQAAPLADLQARLGNAEGTVQEASVRNAAQEATYGIARNDLVTADPFETATRLQAVQLQLETHYTLTARLSRLSLTEYLR